MTSQGCQSWNWFYPYHYAPFPSDLAEVRDPVIQLSMGKPFRPFEQVCYGVVVNGVVVNGVVVNGVLVGVLVGVVVVVVLVVVEVLAVSCS